MRINGARVLFFSVSYRPEHAGIGPYAAATAERLAADGADVRVVAGMPHYPSWRASPEDRWRLRRRDLVGGIPVTRLRQVVPRRHTVISRGLYELSFFLQGLFARQTWQRADVVVGVVPSLAGGLLAQLSAWRNKIPLVLVVQDLSAAGAQQSGILGGRLATRIVSRLEANLFRRAEAIGLVHDSLAPPCLAMGVDPARLHVVPNWSIHEPPDEERRAENQSWKDRFVVLHAGNIGLKQGLGVVVDAAEEAHRRGHDDVLFVLMGDGSQRARIARRGRGLPTLQLMDPVPDDQFTAVLKSADLALVTQRTEVHDMSLPSKLTAYWNAGRAVVASVAPTCGTAREVERSGGGVLVPPADPQALLDTVLDLQAAPDRIRELEEIGQSYAQQHLSAQNGLDRVVALVASGLRASA